MLDAVILEKAGIPAIPVITDAFGSTAREMADLCGVPGFRFVAMPHHVLPAGVPDAIVARLNGESVKVVQDPELAARMARDGTLPAGTTPQDFASYFRNEIAKWAKVIKVSGAKAE